MSEKQPVCYFCGKPLERAEDYFCHGCHNYVCDDCDKMGAMMPFGGHNVELHQEEDYLDEDEEEDED